MQLAHFAEDVARVQLEVIVVQPAGRAKVGQLELAAIGLDALTQHIECAASAYLPAQALEETCLRLALVLFAKLLPLLRLRGIDEIENIPRNQAMRLIILLRFALRISPRHHIARRQVRRQRPIQRRGLPFFESSIQVYW